MSSITITGSDNILVAQNAEYENQTLEFLKIVSREFNEQEMTMCSEKKMLSI